MTRFEKILFNPVWRYYDWCSKIQDKLTNKKENDDSEVLFKWK